MHAQLLSAFQRSHLGTREFELRLIELLAVACHQIAVYLYILDEGNHKHRLYEEWRETPDAREFPGQYVVPTPFYHSSYIFDQQYPNGVADIVGYWAETKIFGGVVLFDRRESGTEVSSISRVSGSEGLAWFSDVAISVSRSLPSSRPLQGPAHHLPTPANAVRQLDQLSSRPTSGTPWPRLCHPYPPNLGELLALRPMGFHDPLQHLPRPSRA